VTVLLEQGALVSATDHNSSTPLHLACQKGHQKCTVSKRERGREGERKGCSVKYFFDRYISQYLSLSLSLSPNSIAASSW
jgi:ankyrin repeat protein